MRVVIRDTEALKAVSPTALSAYARAAGWKKTGEVYREHSDVYVARDRPEIIVPRTERLGDYANVVSQLIEIFARAAETDELSLYRDLVTAESDVIRVRATQERGDGTVAVKDGIDLIQGAHDMLLAAARSFWTPRPVYRGRPDREAADYMKQIRLGQTERGSFAVVLLTPVVKPLMRSTFVGEPSEDESKARRMTRRLTGALAAVRSAIDGGGDGFLKAVEHGASANLCEALLTLIKPFRAMDVNLTWARILPRPELREVFPFASADAPFLREAATALRNWEPRSGAPVVRNIRLVGSVPNLKRRGTESVGTVALSTSFDGRIRTVEAPLSLVDYELAIRAHQNRSRIHVQGDLDRAGQHWCLLNARVVQEEDSSEEGA